MVAPLAGTTGVDTQGERGDSGDDQGAYSSRDAVSVPEGLTVVDRTTCSVVTKSMQLKVGWSLLRC